MIYCDMYKICKKCLISKQTSEFYFEKRFKILFARCKKCVCAHGRKWRQSISGKATYYAWTKSESGKRVIVARMKKWRDKNKIKRSAQTTVSNALRDGRLERKPCVTCKNPKSEGHHPSYSKRNWLKVTWLCKLHHTMLHHKSI